MATPKGIVEAIQNGQLEGDTRGFLNSTKLENSKTGNLRICRV